MQIAWKKLKKKICFLLECLIIINKKKKKRVKIWKKKILIFLNKNYFGGNILEMILY